MDLIHIASAAEFLGLNHPHLGKVHDLGFLKTAIGVAAGTSRKVEALHDYTDGKRQTVALPIEANRFMASITRKFILVTLKNDEGRVPIILKKWQLVDQNTGRGLNEYFGTVNTYTDSDGLKWEYRFKRAADDDELVGFGSDGKELLAITLETH
ncbi:hypothetical protein [Petrachloros mirabilis]